MAWYECLYGGGGGDLEPNVLFTGSANAGLNTTYTIEKKYKLLFFVGGGGIGGSSPIRAYPYPTIQSGNGQIVELFNMSGQSGDAYARGVLYLIKDYDIGTVIKINNNGGSGSTYWRSCNASIIAFD